MKTYLLFGIHCHQPVGNFDSVFQESYEKSYLPFFQTIKNFKSIKCNVHISGPLWEWLIKTNKTDFINILQDLKQRGQVEFLSGGFYEPILPIIPYQDQINQIKHMNSFLQDKFGDSPRGAWLAERVWEPSLSYIINKAGLEFSLIDDSHIQHAGIPKDKITGFFSSEDSGLPIKLFPINKLLRYKIPFSEISETKKILKDLKDKHPNEIFTIVDDGEKFGVWPETYQWVYEKKWLEKFCRMIEDNSDWIETLTFQQALSGFKPKRLVYIPTTTYDEMTEWVLESEAYKKLTKLKEKVGESEFINGGFFRNFLRKYPDINYMHKRMLQISRRINSQFKYPENKDNFEYLFKSQCNCAYWHGLFGGFYLPHLRNSIYENLIRAEKMLLKEEQNNLNVIEEDFDFDSNNELFLRNPNFTLVLSPEQGGKIEEISSYKFAFNFISTLTRKEEVYHQRYTTYLETEADKPSSIHEMSIENRKELQEYIIYDKYRKVSLIDNWINKNISITEIEHNKGIQTCADKKYIPKIEENKNNISVQLVHHSSDYDIKKVLSMNKESGFKTVYNINTKDKNILQNKNFAVEFNLSTLGVISTYIKIDTDQIYHLDDKIKLDKIKTLEIIDTYTGSKLYFTLENMGIIIFPVYSVSLSEHKTEKIFQYSSCFFTKEINDPREEFSINFKICTEKEGRS